MTPPALDRERLLEGLHRAADAATPSIFEDDEGHREHLFGMQRAFRVVAAAIEDGEYEHPADRIRSLMDELRAALEDAKRARGPA